MRGPKEPLRLHLAPSTNSARRTWQHQRTHRGGSLLCAPRPPTRPDHL